jgi:hypothetical protein
MNMNILKIHPLVWVLEILLTFIAYLVRVSPSLDFPFKIGYNIAAFALMYFALCFETWRINSQKTDWKELCEKNAAKGEGK